MTRSQLNRLTVDKLRDRCRRAKLPIYQHRGRRLVKRDLISALVRHGRRKPKLKPKRTTRRTAKQLAKSADNSQLRTDPGLVDTLADTLVDTLAEQLIGRALVDLPGDVTYNRAMHRILRGSKATKDRMILQRRRLVAIATLRDGANDDRASEYWGNKYAAEMNIAGC